MKQTLCAEAIGTLFLVMTVLGSGIMADQLSGGIHGLALIGNTLATGAKFIGDTFNSPLCRASTIPTGRPLLMESRIAAYILVGRLPQHSVDL